MYPARLFKSLLFFSIIVCVSNVRAETGEIDWPAQMLSAIGVGPLKSGLAVTTQRANAIEMAKNIAMNNLLEMVKNIRLNADGFVGQAMNEDEILKSKVESAVRGYTIVDSKFVTTGGIEVRINLPMSGSLLNALLPDYSNPTNSFAVPSSQVYTGLIVDVRGLALQPAIMPKIVDENNAVIFDYAFAERQEAVKMGLVQYLHDIDTTERHARVGGIPLVVKAVAVSGALNTDVVISAADAQAIKDQEFLRQCRIIIVTDQVND